jgi:uncharacterized protein (TIGR02266 family)
VSNSTAPNASTADHSQGSVVPVPRILLVEPASNVPIQTEQAVLSTGCECLRVSSLAVAAAKLGTFRPLMILVDAAVLQEGDKDGCSLLRAQEPNGDVPIVLIANPNTPQSLIEASWRAGIDDCIIRPVRLTQLQARVLALRPNPSKVSAAPPAQVYSVMLVDSEIPFRDRLGRLLELNGFHLLYANGPNQALDLLKSAPKSIQLVVMRNEESASKSFEILRTLKRSANLSKLESLVICDGATVGCVEDEELKVHAVLSRKEEVPEALLKRIHPLFYRVVRDIRADERVPFFCPVEYREIGDETAAWNSCFSYDMSPGGIFLRTLVPARPRASIDLHLHLPAQREEITGTGVVAWANPHDARKVFTYPVGMGIQFVGISPKALTQLRQLCTSLKKTP